MVHIFQEWLITWDWLIYPLQDTKIQIYVFQVKPGLNLSQLWKFWGSKSGTSHQLHEEHLLHFCMAQASECLPEYVVPVKMSRNVVFLFLSGTIKENPKLGRRGNWSRPCNLSYFRWKGRWMQKDFHYPKNQQSQIDVKISTAYFLFSELP